MKRVLAILGASMIALTALNAAAESDVRVRTGVSLRKHGSSVFVTDEDGTRLGSSEWEVPQYSDSIKSAEDDPARIYQYNPNTTENVSAMIEENESGNADWKQVDIVWLSDTGISGDVTLNTSETFSENDNIRAIIGNFMGPAGLKAYEPGETSWATPEDQHNNDEIKWVDTPVKLEDDGLITVNLDGKEENATSVIVAVFSYTPEYEAEFESNSNKGGGHTSTREVYHEGYTEYISKSVHTLSKDTMDITVVHHNGYTETIRTADYTTIEDYGTPLGDGSWEVPQYLQSISDTEGNPALIFQYNANTTENTAEMISENAEEKSAWECYDILVITDEGYSGDMTLSTIEPFAEGSRVKTIIGNFMGPGGMPVYEFGETSWATPEDQHNNDEIKWADTPAKIGSDGSLTINLDNKVEITATSVIVMIFNDTKQNNSEEAAF